MRQIKFIVALLLLIGCSCFAKAQPDEDAASYFNPIRYAVPTLVIAPDARAGSMGDVGAATEPDVYSQHWNPAKYAFAYSKAGIALTYTPWLRKIVDDINLGYLVGYYKLGEEDRHALSGSLRYFSIGEIHMTGASPDDDMGTVSPYEMTADVMYSLKLNENFSMAAGLRFIYSDLGASAAGNNGITPGSAWAGDIAGYYNKYVMLGNSECMLGLGFDISNIGSKLSYNGAITNEFLPANLRLGASLLAPLDDYNTISFNLDINKFLIPTPPLRSSDEIEQQRQWREYNDQSPIAGIFKSFSDAPGGFKEELQELRGGLGIEYGYDNKFFIRSGYFYENPNKGNFRYFTAGAGFKMEVLQLDVAYLISTTPSNPLDQTLRFSLSFDMDGLKNLMR
ncbi:MAG: type IX secretion system outer membrane channel protein PorV [Dysgonamonadaceae bacterium]|jgi:hypothetical protein|nr:type IX secretion system outer membrane channel protein PorV [Dysgonamonadaceae bacterium]